MIRHWSIYKLSDGLFTGRQFSASSDDVVDANTPQGCGALEGIHDWQRTRFDLELRRVVDYQPPQPDDRHDWCAQTRCWKLKPEVAEREDRRTLALFQMKELETREHRYMAEAALGIIDDEGKRRFLAIRTRIGELRKELA